MTCFRESRQVPKAALRNLIFRPVGVGLAVVALISSLPATVAASSSLSERHFSAKAPNKQIRLVVWTFDQQREKKGTATPQRLRLTVRLGDMVQWNRFSHACPWYSKPFRSMHGLAPMEVHGQESAKLIVVTRFFVTNRVIKPQRVHRLKDHDV